jgi:iron(III) transport system permease protein
MSTAAPAGVRGARGASSSPSALLVAFALLPPALVLLPIVVTLADAARVSASDAIDLLFRPLVGALLLNTAMLVVATTLCAALIGTVAAWCVERTALPGRRVWAGLAAVPLAIPAFVTSFAWVSISPQLQDFAGALLVVTCAYFPLVYLPVAAALRGLDPALEETARALGLSPWRCFARVVLPQLRPALLGGMLLVALNTLTEFGAFALLRYRTFTTEIYAEYRTSFNGPEAALLASVLLALCLACLVAEYRVRGTRRYTRVARGTPRRATPIALGWLRWPLFAGFTVLAIVTVGVPLGMIAYWTTRHGANAISPAQASLASLTGATAATLGLGVAGALATTAIAFPLTLLAVRHGTRRFVTLAERSTFLAQGVPGIVVALALVALVIRHVQALYQSAALLVVAYAILFVPLAIVAIRAALSQVRPALEEAARSLGRGAFATAWRVTLPLAGPGIAAAAVLVFVSISTELTSTLLLAPIGTRTLATQVWANASTLAFAAAAPYAALMTLISLAATWLLAGRFGRVGAPAAL